MMKDSMLSALQEANLVNRPREGSASQDSYDSTDDEGSEGVVDEQNDGPLGARVGSALPYFGVGVNDVGGVDINNNADFGNNVNNVQLPPQTQAVASVSLPPLNIPVDPAAPPKVAPDSSLPLPNIKPPTNWFPDERVLSWGILTAEGCEWSAKERDDLSNQFTHERGPIFSATPCPPDMKVAISHSVTKKSDNIFRREATEDFLYEANQDLVCGYRPLLEVISRLSGVPEMEQNRQLLAKVFQSMASAVSFITRGRRELGRPFVPLVNASSLYSQKPSPSCFFGGPSVASAVDDAVSAAKVNKDLIIMPKKRSRPFRSFHPGGKRAYQGGYQSSYRQSGKSENFQKGPKGKGKGRGRGRRGKRQSSSKATAKD